jgi:DMSO/TMAO reductase YedYZ molybdopterin-dependent catalytic subunit
MQQCHYFDSSGFSLGGSICLKEIVMADQPSFSFTERIVLNREPLVSGVPLKSLDGGPTPVEQFFVRNHFPMPTMDESVWNLTIDGEVEHTLSLSYEDLKQLPSRELQVLLECAGNSRASVQPPIEGLLWDHSGVSSARWKGVMVREMLGRAGVKETAREVLFEGADHGQEYGSSGETRFAMSLPMEKALDDDTILAYEINGEALTPEHGYPLRLLVPGWFGMASVKWLTHISVLDYPFRGYHQSSYYVFLDEGKDDGVLKERVSSMRVKSLITWPGRGEVLNPGIHQVRGVAWSGHGAVERLEVSTDGGESWGLADLGKLESPYSWRSWQYLWEALEPGHFLIRARATDVKGNVQPVQAKWNFRGFANNSIHAVPVIVQPSA